MILTIWRHGQAGMASTDRERQLTGRGVDDVGFGAGRFRLSCRAHGIADPDLILHSLWVRTTQTADIIGNHFPLASREASTALVPGRTAAGVDAELERWMPAEPDAHLLLVSHQPLVSTLVDHYLGEPGRVAPLVPGGLATLRLEVPAFGCGELLFSAQPPEYEAQA